MASHHRPIFVDESNQAQMCGVNWFLPEYNISDIASLKLVRIVCGIPFSSMSIYKFALFLVGTVLLT